MKDKVSLKDPEDNPCWKGYKPVGTKMKNGRKVPNCVPESFSNFVNSLQEMGRPLHKMSDEELSQEHKRVLKKVDAEWEKGKRVTKGHRLSGRLRQIRFHQVIRDINPELGYKHVKKQ
jgi:hypothetical protein